MTDAIIRTATAEDAPACAVILNAWIDATPWMIRDLSADGIETALRDGFPKREAYVIGDPVAGYLSMDPEDAHIHGFYVGLRGQGLGRALLDKAKEGRSFLSLNTHQPNTRAQKFYSREGFTQVGGVIDKDTINEIRMEWRS